MQANRQVRVIKREQRAGGNEAAAAPTGVTQRNASERDMRAVVTGWVREHREGVQDYRRALSTLFARLDAGATRAA
jgi:hypothetical protein